MIKIIMLLLLVFMPVRINASDVEKFNYNENRIYDYSNIFDNKEEETLTNEINRFIKLSKIDLIIVSVDDELEQGKLYHLIDSSKKFGIGIEKRGVALVANKESFKINIYLYGNGWYDNTSLVKFNGIYVNKYDKGNTSIFEINRILKEWNHYYILNTIKTNILIMLLSLIITVIICKLIQKKYKIKKISDASSYYDPKEIKFLS